ncbi:hypothetical protein [Actinospica robiniae]|uniref:hypothetical protein n=1 Tax=Actinospica robiniae TaxID=304901 RepID=UPI000423A666|nr:hypothetical protein [Actinospica robiniae]
MPRKPKTVAAAHEPCPACDGTGETEQVVTRSRRSIKGQLGVCLACFGDGIARDVPTKTAAQPYHP